MDRDSRDLEAILQAVEGCEVVLLGELAHGDGTTQALKARIAAFLLEEGDFSAVGWEAGPYECHRMSRLLHEGVPAVDAVKEGLFGVWRTEEVAALLQRTQEADKPIEHFGFDCQTSSRLGAAGLGPALARWARHLVTDLDEETLASLVTSAVRSAYDPEATFTPEAQSRLCGFLDTIVVAIEQAPQPLSYDDEWFVMERAVRNLLVQVARQRLLDIRDEVEPTTTEERRRARVAEMQSFNARDAAMAANLVSWMHRHPGHRVVCWLATGHAARNVSSEVGLEFLDAVTFGDHIWQAFAERSYALASLTYRGATRTLSGVVAVPARPVGALEHRLHGGGVPLGFVDLRSRRADEWADEPVKCFPLGHHSTGRCRLARIVDGFLYVDVMQPSTPLP